MRLLLIGWDSADWSLIQPLLERGQAPYLQHFLSQGLSGDLQPVRPFDSAALWTSLVTGKRAMGHGVLSAVEVDAARTRIRPASRWTRTAPAVWSILSEAGFRTHAFGWPASHPAEAIHGVNASDQFAEYGEEDSVQPARLFETLCELRLSPTEIDAASLVTLLPRAGELNPAADQRLFAVAKFLASTASLHAAATWALEHEPWEFAAVRYSGLARLATVFGPAHAAAQAGEQSCDAEMFGCLLPNGCRFFDMLLGRLLELAGPDTSVILVSQHGWAPASPSPRHGTIRPGIIAAAGRAFRSRRQLPVISVLDVTPTILGLFGVASEPGFHGRDVLSQTAAAATADWCHDEMPIAVGEPPAATSAPPDSDSVAHLLALGYRERPDEFLRFAIEQLKRECQRRLAEAWSDAGEHDRAAQVLEGLAHMEPTSVPIRSALAEAYFRAGEYDACRRLILALQDDGVWTPLSETGLAAVEVLAGDSSAAIDHLKRAEQMGGAPAAVLELIGRLYLQLQQPADAVRVLDAAIALDSMLAAAHDGRAVACLSMDDPFTAESFAREAVKLSPHSYEARYHLGLALMQQNRADEAINVFRVAVALDHRGRGASAHRHLADLLQRRGDHAVALYHRAQSYRRES